MSHKVTLTWQEPSALPGTDPATSFNIKRASISGGPYTTIGSVTQPTETYEDDAVKAGDTWFYVTTAVNPSAESAPSSEVKATVPFLAPGTPSNLVAVAV